MEANKRIALLGDVGGTNIRLELVEVQLEADEPVKLKEETFKVKDYDVFQNAIETFLKDVLPENYPQVAAIAMAGPISNNTVFLANVPKWERLDGDKLGQNLKIKHFRFLNDFEAASYGVLIVPENQFESINGLKVDPSKVRGIMGPGTGLGNSVLFPITLKQKTEVIVIPSEGGHTDSPDIDEETHEYYKFFMDQIFIVEGKEVQYKYISLERAFCGPNLPVMFKFFCQKHPEDKEAKEAIPTPQKILEVAMSADPPRIYECVFQLFLKIYQSAISNFTTHHMTVGGMYLTNSITNTIYPRLKGLDMFKPFKERHPDVAPLLEGVPIVVCKVVELGLKGAFFIARRIYSQNP